MSNHTLRAVVTEGQTLKQGTATTPIALFNGDGTPWTPESPETEGFTGTFAVGGMGGVTVTVENGLIVSVEPTV